MSVVEDLRKLLQDVVAPDLKALDVRLTALEKKIDLKFEALENKFDLKFETLDDKIDGKHDLVMAEIRNQTTIMTANFARMDHSLDLDRRLERIENERAQASREPRLERTA